MRPHLPLAVAVLLAFVAPVESARLPVTRYTTVEGLPDDHVHRILTDSQGLLWFATRHGVSRFDGVRFFSFDAARGLPQGEVTGLLAMREGSTLVATEGGIARLDPHEGADHLVPLDVDTTAAPSPLPTAAGRASGRCSRTVRAPSGSAPARRSSACG